MAIKAKEGTHKLVPPGEHRRNIAYKSIQTYKNHFVGVFAGINEFFPMQLWFRLLPQADMQLNIQRQSAIIPKIAAYAHVLGPHSFIHKSLSPLGCPVLAHEKPYKKGDWSDHAISAWNLGISMEHHRSLNVYRKDKRAERIVNTLFFKHKYITSPIVASKDTVVEAAKKIIDVVTANSKIKDYEQM